LYCFDDTHRLKMISTVAACQSAKGIDGERKPDPRAYELTQNFQLFSYLYLKNKRC